MLTRLALSGVLMAACVALHAVGSMALLRWLDRSGTLDDLGLWRGTRLLVRIAGGLVGMHLADITLWAAFYAIGRALPAFAVALYFSAVTYTTVGYGDVVLPEGWRLVGGIEALTGILMCGWSTGFFFSVVTRLQRPRRDADQDAAPRPHVGTK